jgi:hypothetical protein
MLLYFLTLLELLKISNNQLSRDYLETVHSCGSQLGKASRIVGETFSQVDHILCNNFNQDFITRTFILDINVIFLNFLQYPM